MKQSLKGWTVKELKEMLRYESDEAVVFAIYTDSNGNHVERPIYKSATDTDDTEHYLYLGEPRKGGEI